MTNKAQYGKIIFGLKVHQLRESKNFSFSELSDITGISISYLNEIEKGKKYPKPDKVILLADALCISADALESPELPKNLQPLEELLRSNFLNELPLDLFGIELFKVVEMIASAPARVGAFIYTLVELSRNYALGEQNFYFAALRSYLELNNNYFEDLENAVTKFISDNNMPVCGNMPEHLLAALLKEKFGYHIVENGLDAYPALENIRAFFIKEKQKLLLNSRLTDAQRAFQFGKELGFNVLGLKERAYTASLLKVNNFDEVLNHFKAGYFSAALLMPRDSFCEDIAAFFQTEKWDEGAFFKKLILKYNATPEMLFQRMTNVLPKVFGLEKLFFLRILHPTSSNKFEINKELHLSGKHHPQSSSMNEHYCHRWISIGILTDSELRIFDDSKEEISSKINEQAEKNLPFTNMRFGIQRSIYHKTGEDYICFSVAKSIGNIDSSVTIGILLDDKAREKIKLLNDVSIPSRIVSNTCERCDMTDCRERQAPPRIVQRREQRREINEALESITNYELLKRKTNKASFNNH